jgi:hypothetical protein
MGFTKKTASQAGAISRRKGTPNKDTTELRQKVNILLSDNWEQILSDIAELSAKERIDTFIKLMEYSIPKLNRTEVVAETTFLTEEEREARIKELKIKLEEDGYFD